MERICPQCHQQFSTDNKNQIYCSRTCNQKQSNSKRPKNPIVTKTCPYCQSSFTTNKPFKVFCSFACESTFHSLKRAKHPEYKRRCHTCKKEFIAKRHDKTFCSKKCLWKYRSDRKPRLTSKSYFKADKLRSQHIPQDQLEIIYGTLLGDGTLILQTNNFHRLSLCHSEKQLPYLRFKKKKLSSIFLQKNVNRYEHPEYTFKGNLIMGKIQYHSHSISHKDLTNLYGIFYRNKKQIITMNVLNLLTPTSLLIWYLDDGSMSFKGRSIKLCTHTYSLSDVKTLKYWFWNKYSIKTTIGFQKNTYFSIPKKYPILHFPVESTKQFLALLSLSPIFKELPHCMAYKFRYKPYANN